jgi:hypothetical protein
VIAQPLVWHYLWPSTPIYMACGITALIALAVLVVTGLAARSALREETVALGGGRPPAYT